jgi:putative ABC transport system ATP-binding protein
MSEAARDAERARSIGYIFQTFNLLQGFSALENVLLGMAFRGAIDEIHGRALLGRVYVRSDGVLP